MDPSSNSTIFAGDYFGGLMGALAAMMAVWHRKKTGRGQLVEVAQAEAASAMLAQAFMEQSLNGRLQSPLGNRSVYGASPSGVYPCLSMGTAATGDDRWIAITVTNDAEWLALRGQMGDPDWAQAPELATFDGRAAAQNLLDAKLADWTQGFDDYELFHQLQAAGVPAAPVLEASRVLDDPHVQQRGVFQPFTMFDDVGTFRFMTPFYRFPETPSTVRQPPVAMGEHNDYVYRELLGLSDAEYQALVAQGHISMDFDAFVP
jgi:crotonobetainyl-CoA:carnitine CoA-transferase CaiB-like acyl-CoA transferase